MKASLKGKRASKKKEEDIDIFPQTSTSYDDFVKKVADLSPSLITVYNIQTWQYVFVNKAVKSMLGYTPKDWIEGGVEFASSIVHPDDLTRIMQQNSEAIKKANDPKKGKKNIVVHFEYRIRHKNGKWMWVHTYGTVFDRDNKGDIRHVLNISLDITQRHEIEDEIKKKEEELRKLNTELEETVRHRTQALRESENRLKEAQRITNMGSWEYDLETGKIVWSEGIYRIHGLDSKKGEPDYQTFLELFVDPKILEKHVRLAVTKGIPYQIDVAIRRPDSSIGYIQAIGQPIKNDKGKIVTLYGTTIDITDRKLGELRTEFLSETGKILGSSFDYETTFQKIAALAVRTIADWCILDVKKGDAFERLLVIHSDPKKAALAQKLKKEYPPHIEDPGTIGDVLRTGVPKLNTMRSQKTSLRGARSNPRLLSLVEKLGIASYMVIPIILRGTVVGAITFVSSAIQRKYNKDDLLMVQELARRISIAIENAALYQHAQDAVKIRDEFISIASHELKTPVTSMKMYSQILERILIRQDDTEALPFIKKINDQINKQTKLIADLLDISKLQLGKLEFKEEQFDLTEMVKEVVESVQLISERHVFVITGDTRARIIGDRDRISQVLINLLTNAMKYSPKSDQVLINILQSKDKITVSVTDYGIGIAEENQEKIFDRFYQVRDAFEKTYPGLGIGLYISNEIIKRHRGVLSVQSKKGKGSTFSFTLPVKITS